MLIIIKLALSASGKKIESTVKTFQHNVKFFWVHETLQLEAQQSFCISGLLLKTDLGFDMEQH